jgi:putative transposase
MDDVDKFYGNTRALLMNCSQEIISDLLVIWAKDHGIELRYIQPGKPNRKAYLERLNKSSRMEVPNARLFYSLGHVE